MGKHSNESDSGGSRRDHKKRSSHRSRSPSASKSSGESGSSHHRKKAKRSSKESRSPSKSKSSSETSRRRRSPSPHKASSSRSRHRKSSSRSPVHSSKSRGESRSRSKEESKHEKSSSRSGESSSKDKNKREKTSPRSEVSAKLSPIPEIPLTQDQQLKMKMQMALKAAAEADAQLRQKGILLSAKSDVQVKLTLPKPEAALPALTVHEQISKAQAITAINAQGFEPSNFVSGRSITQESLMSKSIMDNHDAVMFGTNTEAKAIESQLSQKATAIFESIIKDDLIHPNLFGDVAAKQERWIKRLYNMRQKKLNGEAMS